MLQTPPLVNKIHSCQPLNDSDTVLIDTDTAKAWLRIDFDDDNDLIDSLVKSVIASIEMYTSVKIQPGTMYVVGDIYCELELPYGPVVLAGDPLGITSYSTRDGNGVYTQQTAGTGYFLDGVDFIRLVPLTTGRAKIVYDAGYPIIDEIPGGLLDAIKAQLAYRYENRGDLGTGPGLCADAKGLANPYRRLQWI